MPREFSVSQFNTTSGAKIILWQSGNHDHEHAVTALLLRLTKTIAKKNKEPKTRIIELYVK
jgi:hypothetical protein